MVKGSGFTITSGMLVSECRLCKIGEFLPSAFNKDLFKSSYVCSLDLRLVGVVVLTGADMISLGYLKHMYLIITSTFLHFPDIFINKCISQNSDTPFPDRLTDDALFLNAFSPKWQFNRPV
jgi:hypothetical protein